VTTAYTATITDFDGAITTHAYSAVEADALIETAIMFDIAKVTPAADRSGRLTITRNIASPRSACDPTLTVKTRTTVLQPAHAPRLTNRQHQDLALIRKWEARPSDGATLDQAGRIVMRFHVLTALAARRLIDRGWLTITEATEEGTPVQGVTVSYAGRIAMALYEHRTRTGSLASDYSASGAFGSFSVPCPPTYFAACACGWQGPSRSSEDPAIARGHAKTHRQEHLQRVFLTD
jgi:hypothetical protein